MNYKRGVLIWFSLLFFLLLFSVKFVFALNVNKDTYVAIGGIYDEDGDEDWCDNSNVEIRALAPKGTKPNWFGDNEWNQNTVIPPDKGCWFLILEDDGGYDDNANDAWDCVLDYNFNYANPLICADDKFWHQCTSVESSLGSFTWVNNNVFNCTLNEYGILLWRQLPGTDLDHDGITTNNGDCDDNPSDDHTICKDITVDQCSLSTSQCAICINPDAVETCGDTADNDCNPDTSDNCH